MNYELVTNIGYAGIVVFAILTIFLCFKLNIKNCILEVTGLERKKRVKIWKDEGKIKDNGGKRKTSKKADKKRKTTANHTEILIEPSFSEDIQHEKIEHTILLTEKEETNILYEDTENTNAEEQKNLEFVYLKDIVVVHTGERIG